MSSKGEPADEPKSLKEDGRREPREPCVCGGRHPYYVCWYLNEVDRLSWWKPTELVQKAVDQKIADALLELKAKIERARKPALQDKKSEDGDM